MNKKLILLFVLAAWLFASCSQTAKEKKYIIAFSECMGSDSWRQTMLDDMKRELAFHNNVQFIYRDANSNSNMQVRQIEELAKQHIDLLIVSPNEVQPLSDAIQKVYDAGIPVVLVDRRTNSRKYTAFVGAENYEVGQNAGRFAVSVLKGRGNILEVSAQPDASPFIDRHNGFLNIIDGYPDMKYLRKIDGSIVNNKVKQAIQSSGHIDLIFAHNDMMAFDVYNFCKELGIAGKVKIIGIDGLPVKNMGLDMVANKYIAATVLYPTGGREAITTALNILEGNPFKKENQLFTSVIDSSNVMLMKMQGEKLMNQQSDIEQRQKIIDKQILITRNQSTAIIIIALTLSLALIFGGLSFYYLNENKKISRRLALQNNEISEQKNQLIEISAKAEAAHVAKLNFFTNISHEFRTPLTLILSPLEDLVLSPKVQVSTRQTLQLVHKNVIRLYRLVNQLMDFRKIEFSKMRVRASMNNLVDFIKEIVDSYKVLSQQKNISLNFLTTERRLDVWFDITMIDKVIFNLLSNAFKFTKENGFIYVKIEKTEQDAIVKIEDNGIGMSVESIQHVFEPFFQGEYENYKGTGLGLALSKELIELHHGSISVSSEKWKGTSFEIRLPLNNYQLTEKEKVEVPESPAVITEDARIYTTELIDQVQGSVQEPDSIIEKKYSILIIEDNNDLRKYLKNKLFNFYDIIEAGDANIALEAAFDSTPDLIICDVVIPGKNGLELTKILKEDARSAHIPVILLTARSDEHQKLEGIKTGADAYITKPFNFPFLEQTIFTLLNNREKSKEHYSGEVISGNRSVVAKKTDRKFINDLTLIVENNISNEHFSIEDICSEMKISHVQLYRKVKSLLHCRVTEYIMNARLQKARYYLQHEDLSISEVAFRTGFSSATYFSTAFKSKFTVTPSEFRENGVSQRTGPPDV